MSEFNLTILLLLSAGALVMLMMFYAVGSIFGKIRRRGRKDRPDEMGFMVETFHDLVSRLKKNEKELERLRAMAEERAGKMEDYNENILQSVPSGVVSLDSAWKAVKINASAARILDVRAEDFEGKSVREVLPGSFESLFEQGSEGRVERGESHYVTPSGKRTYLGFSLSPLLDSAGKNIGHLLVFTDLTELKALESQARLRQNLESLGEMAAGIAHELRNPMGVIAGYMRLLSRKTDSSLAGAVEAVNVEVATMDRIITDFLSFARPGTAEFSELDVGELVDDCVQSVLGLRDDIKANVHVESNLKVKADRVVMRQALTNLLQNAAEAQPGGGKVGIVCERQGDYVHITVSDRGHGIPEGLRENIYLPFYTTKEKGTGLGLALVHRAVTGHGGSIEVQSGEDGTVFRLQLPGAGPS